MKDIWTLCLLAQFVFDILVMSLIIPKAFGMIGIFLEGYALEAEKFYLALQGKAGKVTSMVTCAGSRVMVELLDHDLQLIAATVLVTAIAQGTFWMVGRKARRSTFYFCKPKYFSHI